jgi:phospholipid/cholesterol/gamma-HCH transport system substrate-binding protein
LKVRNEIKIGALIVVALGLLYFGLNYLKGSDIFSKARFYYAVYDRIDGLTRDNPIMLNGAKIGRVTGVDLMPSLGNKVLVKMEIQLEDLLIPDSTRAIIVNQDLLGSKAINLEFPINGKFDINGDTLIPGIEKEISQVVEESLAPIQAKIERLVDESSDLVAHVKITVNTINETVHTAETAIGTIQHATVSIDTMITQQSKKLSAVLNNVTAITSNLKANSENINNILENIATISDSLITSINNGQGSLGMLVTDDKLYRNLEQAAIEIDKLAEDIRRNPKRYVAPLGKKNKDPQPLKPRDANGRVILQDE